MSAQALSKAEGIARTDVGVQQGPSLELGHPVERETDAGDVHSYSIVLERDRIFRALIESNVDLVIDVVRPDGRRDSHTFIRDARPSKFILVTESTGMYRLEVRATDGPRGQYKLTVEQTSAVGGAEINSPQPRDLRRQQEELAKTQKRQILAEYSQIQSRTREDRAKPLTEPSNQTEDTLSLLKLFDAVRDPAEEDAKSYVKLSGTDRISLTRVRKTLPDDTTLLSYFVTSDQPVVFIINSRTVIKREIPISYNELKSSLDTFVRFPSTSEVQWPTLQQWYSWLITPIEGDLEAPNLGIIGDGPPQQIPFAALTKDRKTYLSEKFNLFYLPSLDLFSVPDNKRRKTTDSILVVAPGGITGLAFLEGSKREVSSIKRLYKIKRLLGPDATSANFMRNANKHRIVHIISHAECNNQKPRMSYIVMAQDADKSASLWVDTVTELNLKSIDLVVLSACETKVCGEYQRDVITTLNDAFIAAGASTVIASLWPVDDKATSFLMSAFYKHLKHMGKAAALSEAQKDMRLRYSEPYYWAAFVLTGQPGPPAVKSVARH